MERERLLVRLNGHAFVDAAIVKTVVVGKRNFPGKMAAKLDPTSRCRRAVPIDRRREANRVDPVGQARR